MIEKVITEIFANHRGKALGMIIGLIVGIFLINFGFWKTILLLGLIFGGYVVGKQIDNNDDMSEVIGSFIYKDKRFK